MMIEFHREYVAGKDTPTGTLEDSWLYGAQFQATAFYLNEIITEIQTQKKLTIRPYSAGPSYATALAKDYRILLETRNNLFAIVAGMNDKKDLLKAMQNCRKVLDPSQAGQIYQNGQQASQLCASRMALERAFLNIATAEALGRAQDSYLTKIGSAPARTQMYGWIRETMKLACLSESDEAGANRCYQANVGTKMRDYLKQLWPINPTIAEGGRPDIRVASAGLSPFFILGLGLGVPGLRRRRKAGPRKTRRSLRLLSLIGSIAILGAAITDAMTDRMGTRRRRW